MKKFASFIMAFLSFLLVMYLFHHIGDILGIELTIKYDEPRLHGGGPTAYESDSGSSYLGYIASYVSILLAIIIYNISYDRSLKWFEPKTNLIITYLSLGVLSVLIPMQVIVCLLGEASTKWSILFRLLHVVAFLTLTYLSWRFYYYIYARKKSSLLGFNIWAYKMPDEKLINHYYIIQAKSKKNAMDYIELCTSHKNKIIEEEITKCNYKRSHLRSCKTTLIAAYVNANDIEFID